MARPIITKPTLLSDLRSLGVGDFTGSAVMVHTPMSALGTVIGGAQTVVEALIEVLGPDGTLLVLSARGGTDLAGLASQPAPGLRLRGIGWSSRVVRRWAVSR